MVLISFKNIILKDWDEYSFSQFFVFKNKKDGSGLDLECRTDKDASYESSQSIFRHALDLAIPEVVLSAYCSEGYPIWVTRPLRNSCGCSNYEPESMYEINQEKMDHITRWFNLLLDYTKSTKDNWGNLVSSWNVAFNEYINAVTSVRVEKAYVHLIDSLEFALAQDNAEVRYKVSLYTAILYSDDKDERKRVYELITKAYGIRSKVESGRSFSNDGFQIETLYQEFLELKEIVSVVLLKTYRIEKNQVIDNIEDSIFGCNRTT